MSIVLDHMIVPARDKEQAARFLARIFGLSYKGTEGHFAAVRVNETLTLDFDTDTDFASHHYAFKVGEVEFDAIFARIRAEGIPYGRSAHGVEHDRFRADSLCLVAPAKGAFSARQSCVLRLRSE